MNLNLENDFPSLDKLLEYVSSEPRARTNGQIETPPEYLFIVSEDFVAKTDDYRRLMYLFFDIAPTSDIPLFRNPILTPIVRLKTIGNFRTHWNLDDFIRRDGDDFLEKLELDYISTVQSEFTKEIKKIADEHPSSQLVFCYNVSYITKSFEFNGTPKFGVGTNLPYYYSNDIFMFLISTLFPQFSRKMFLNTGRSFKIIEQIAKGIEERSKILLGKSNIQTNVDDGTNLPSIQEIEKRVKLNSMYFKDSPEYVLVPINTTASETIFRYRQDIRLYQVNILNYLGYQYKVLDVLGRNETFQTTVERTMDERVLPVLSVVRAENPTSKLVFCYDESQFGSFSPYDGAIIQATLPVLNELIPGALFLNLSRDDVRPIIDKSG